MTKYCGYCGVEFNPDEKYFSICQNCKENDVLRYGDETQSKVLTAMSVLLTLPNHYEEEELSESGAMHELMRRMFKNLEWETIEKIIKKSKRMK